MNLKKYDGKCVQITHIDNKIYEGICSYDSKDYCYHEFGRNEEALEIFSFLFYRKEIKKIVCLDDFSEPYGEIEKIIVDDGISSIEDALDSEENEHIYRVLKYLETKPINNDIVKLLKKTLKYNSDDLINEEINKIINSKGE